ncbi:hypothetical protein ACFQ0M_30905 [Kitasatospora aburaviensis]
MEGIGDLLEQRQFLDSGLAVHVVVEPSLADLDGGGNSPGAEPSRIEEPEHGTHVAGRTRAQQTLVLEQSGGHLA